MKTVRKTMNGVVRLGRVSRLGRSPKKTASEVRGARIRQKRTVDTRH